MPENLPLDAAPSLADRLWGRLEQVNDGGLRLGRAHLQTAAHLLLFRQAHRRLARRAAEATAAGPAALAALAEAWADLTTSADTYGTYRRLLHDLSAAPETALGAVFVDAHQSIDDPVVLRELIAVLDEGLARDAGSVSADDEGEVLSDLLERALQHLRGSDPDYYTPRALVDLVVATVRPGPDDTITDPACKAGSFLIAAHRYIREHDPGTEPRSAGGRIRGNESALIGLAGANLLLHGITEHADCPGVTNESPFALPPMPGATVVIANPPFGTMKGGEKSVVESRADLPVRTSSKALDYLQHIMSVLLPGGRAGVIVPDSVLFATGAARDVRRLLLQTFDVHTLIRLPAGAFPTARGVRTSILLFDRQPTERRGPGGPLWVYDLRTGSSPTGGGHLDTEGSAEILQVLRMGDRSSRQESADHRFRPFIYDELMKREDTNLDLVCPPLEPPVPDSRPPGVIAAEITEKLKAALSHFEAVTEAL
ncbi:HsdM family class I SAM-dependent methyltransferase [Kitasatospora setae]|uniref:HsdM family class I SAM-dependent methyltransferase n=1 Tax=Kitasatospora setae TaxID=2066 RepID=UPI000686C298|nr:SAM-dependent methyltransferase [Kitasatospora setae]